MFWEKELEVFTHNLSLLRQHNQAEALHDIRVSIKKLRSCIKLHVAITGKEQAEKTFQSTEVLFSVLGMQRNTEMSRQLAAKLFPRNAELATTSNNYFDGLINIAAQNSSQVLRQYNESRLISLKLFRDEDITDKVTSAIHTHLKSIRQDAKDFDDKFHRVRKKLKDVFYWAKNLPAGALFSKQQLQLINKTLDRLGDAQDQEMLLQHLKTFRKTIFAKDEKEYILLKKAEEKTGKKRIALAKEARTALREVLLMGVS